MRGEKAREQHKEESATQKSDDEERGEHEPGVEQGELQPVPEHGAVVVQTWQRQGHRHQPDQEHFSEI